MISEQGKHQFDQGTPAVHSVKQTLLQLRLLEVELAFSPTVKKKGLHLNVTNFEIFYA